MDQLTLRRYAADGIRRQIALLTQQLQELERQHENLQSVQHKTQSKENVGCNT